jgi:hypothetical protein
MSQTYEEFYKLIRRGKIFQLQLSQILLLKHMQLIIRLSAGSLCTLQLCNEDRPVGNASSNKYRPTPPSLEGSYPSGTQHGEVLEHLTAPFCAFSPKIFSQKAACVIDLRVCGQKVNGLGTRTE